MTKKEIIINSLANKVKTAFQNNDFDLAIKHFEKALSKNPDAKSKQVIKDNLDMVYNNHGIANGNLGNHQEAIEDFNKALKINPKLVKAYNNRGLTNGN